MDDGLGGDFEEIYYGENSATLTTYTVTNLTPGRQYRFKTQAENMNGFGLESTITSIYACTEPSQFAAPKFKESTSTSLTIQWEEPEENGGCAITGYAVFRDDHDATDPSIEVNSANDASVRNIPTLREKAATLLNTDIGETYRFKVQVFNQAGLSAFSDTVSMIFATVPGTPSAPTEVSSSTDSITISFTATDNGGDTMTKVNLEYALVGSTDWKTIQLSSSNWLGSQITIDDITQGETYQFQF